MVARGEDGLGTVDGADLAVDVVQMGPDRRDRELHLSRDLLVDHAVGEVASEDVELAGRERARLGRSLPLLAGDRAARGVRFRTPSGPRPQRLATVRRRSGLAASPWE